MASFCPWLVPLTAVSRACARRCPAAEIMQRPIRPALARIAASPPQHPPLNPCFLSRLFTTAPAQPPDDSKPAAPLSPPVHPPIAPAPTAASAAAARPPAKAKPVRQEIVLDEKDLEESFVKGGGKGGQKVNKTNSRVQLRHVPTGIIVMTQRFRELAANRKEARKLLRLRLDEIINGALSKASVARAKVAKQKSKQAQRAKKKYGGKEGEEEGGVVREEEVEGAEGEAEARAEDRGVGEDGGKEASTASAASAKKDKEA
ncbi:RF-1 domain-containing protein [Zopfochytrium polystomum]|nr:RF-1 domain-containing protein [Zopfochytrium polystomum]